MRLKAAAAAAAQQQQQPLNDAIGIRTRDPRSQIGFETTRPPPRANATERLKLIFIPNPDVTGARDRVALTGALAGDGAGNLAARARAARPPAARSRPPDPHAPPPRAPASAIAAQHASRCLRCEQIRARPWVSADAIDRALTARGRAARDRVPLAPEAPTLLC